MKKILSGVILGVMALALFATPVLAISSTPDQEENLGLGFAKTSGLGDGDLRATIGNIISVVLGFLGIVAIVIILIGGFTWMTAGGNDEKVGEAKKWIFSGIIGLAIILSAYAIAQFVVGELVDKTGFTG
ncbi:MAG: hypothetical protein A3J93_02475 [Candidatus Magasanikbacteria bacterium RIFOXYC2_FULL_42_28]|uniref:TrbC/VIRB2 family protein n=1 Tax=Candidatus Magasanikbacteria bacterium RIFOXYC2_FULL_42_28 TaxID=1798704 RepID=A0A1F6NWC5_9BACT|nr:MAG: hypothetical protein A3J93_02475 [Candidatus Magasanikbacteria bacterium RIFOXYC2_FULL_42_28]